MGKILRLKKTTGMLSLVPSASSSSAYERKMAAIKEKQNKKTTEIEQVVFQFKNAMGKTAVAYLELSKIAYDASLRFGGDKWAMDNFVEQIGLSKSYLRKLALIGERADILLKHIDYLPQSMNALYEMSQLEERDFKSVIQHKHTLNLLSATDIAKWNRNKVRKPEKDLGLIAERKSKEKLIKEFADNLLKEHKYQVESIEIRYDPPKSLMPATMPKIVSVKTKSKSRSK
ncbi:hypothetical protein MCEMSE6_00529 [Oxalobacteraceae bacterium]